MLNYQRVEDVRGTPHGNAKEKSCPERPATHADAKSHGMVFSLRSKSVELRH